jgi:aminopeptidase YwaD
MRIDTIDVIRRLADGIGIRVAGSSREAAAADYLAGLLKENGWAFQRQAFEYRGWLAGIRGTLAFDGAADGGVEGLVLPYTLPTPVEGLEGWLVYGGRATIIPERIVCERFYLQSTDGKRVGRILVVPYDDLRPVPNPRAADSLPTVVLGSSAISPLRQAIDAQRPARLICPPGEFLARGQNILGQPDESDEQGYLLLVAHYDSVFGSPGANDNASGVAVALAVMQYARNVGYRVRLLLTAAEELMFRGAEAYLAYLRDEDRVSEIDACLCLDMLGVGDTLKLRAPKGGIWAIAGHELRGESFLNRELPSSDHWVFHEAGLPSAQLTRQVDPHYHSPYDTSSRISREALGESVEVACKLLDLVVPRLKREKIAEGWHGQ